MGLMDYVYVPDEALMDLGVKGGDFQTKSLPYPYLRQYRITVDGRLEKWVDENGQWSDVAYDGDLVLTRNGEGGWEKYAARFTDGRWTRTLRYPDLGVTWTDEKPTRDVRWSWRVVGIEEEQIDD